MKDVKKRKSITIRKGPITDPELKLCKECSFEARNGHSFSCSKRVKVLQCPECRRRKRYGTLEKLNENELQRLRERLGDKLEGNFYGCDECKFYIAEDLVEE